GRWPGSSIPANRSSITGEVGKRRFVAVVIPHPRDTKRYLHPRVVVDSLPRIAKRLQAAASLPVGGFRGRPGVASIGIALPLRANEVQLAPLRGGQLHCFPHSSSAASFSGK